jgi:hypothetical protein
MGLKLYFSEVKHGLLPANTLTFTPKDHPLVRKTSLFVMKFSAPPLHKNQEVRNEEQASVQRSRKLQFRYANPFILALGCLGTIKNLQKRSRLRKTHQLSNSVTSYTKSRSKTEIATSVSTIQRVAET